MKLAFVVLQIVIAYTNSYGSDWTYRHLSKIYEKDVKKCLTRSKTIIDHLPEKAPAYYFACRITIEKIDQVDKLLLKFGQLNYALNCAVNFEKKATDELLDLVEWSDFVSVLKIKFDEIYFELENNNQQEYANRLSKKWSKIENSSPDLAEDLSVDEVDAVAIENRLPGQLYGMPTGSEDFESYNTVNEKKMVYLINKERIKLGMDTLIWNEDLARACRYHATDLGTQNYFSHYTYDLSKGKLVLIGDPFERISKFYSTSFVNSENIAAGNSSAEETYDQWYTSPGHYKNMFNPESKMVGVGVAYIEGSEYGYYWSFCTAK